MVMPIRIAIIDDDESVRRALTRLVKLAGMEAATFSTAREFIDHPTRQQTDCVVSDIRMPGLDGLKLQEELNQALPDVSVIFLTGYGKVSTTVRAMKAGAVDFLEKPIDDESLLDAITHAVEKTRQSRAKRLELEDLQQRFGSLTPREREVFALVTSGLLNKQAGAKLEITERTIKVHRARVLEKMEANSLADLVHMAERLNLTVKGEVA
jgi:FixJ family two-component response regulator